MNMTFNVDFMSRRKMAMVFSTLLIVASIAALAMRGLNLGIDFTGGVLIEVGYQQPADLTQVRSHLAQAGYGEATAQHFGTAHEVLIRMAPDASISKADLSSRIVQALNQDGQEVSVRRVEFVGPQIGDELTEQGGMAMLVALVGILIYVSLRFEYRFAIGSVAALIHDVIITLGFFAATQVEFDLSVLAAVLAVIGYSLNDTIVVFDRIRENFRKVRKGTPESIANTSINETLTRTVVTSLTTLLVLIALYLFGGEIINGFATALIVGIVVGTYSSIFVASTASLALGISKQDLVRPPKPRAEGGDMP